MVSDYGETALITAILVIDIDRHGGMKLGSDYFALQLIQRGADIFYRDNFGYTTLSCASLKHHVKMAEDLIERGVCLDHQDVYGNTALHDALDHEGPDALEFVSLLLYHGADPRIRNKDDLNPFEKSVLHCSDTVLQEILFYYTYDEYTELATHLSVLLRLAQYESPLLLMFEGAVIDDFSRGSYGQIFYIDVEYLKILIKRFEGAINTVLPLCTLYEWSRNAVSFEKIEVFINSSVKSGMVACLQNEEDDLVFQHLIDCELDEGVLSGVVCYFLSYGLNLTESGLQRIFQKFGYCELFKILLHMDVEMVVDYDKQIMPTLIYDITLDLDGYLENIDNYSSENVEYLLRFFVNRRLNELCWNMNVEEISLRICSLPQVPLLLELARNVFRQYFIDKFEIRTSRRFYTLLNNLNISQENR